MKICVVTTSFIRDPEDGYARFVYEQAKSLLRTGYNYEIVVVAPHAPGLARYEVVDGLHIHRFRYFFPTNLERLAYQHEGLFNTLRTSWVAVLQLPGFLVAMVYALWRQARGASVIHAQWIPTALAATPVSCLRGIPICVSARGADVNTCRSSQWGLYFTRFILNRVKAVVTVSTEFQEALQNLNVKPPVYALYNGVDTNLFRPHDPAKCKQLIGLSHNSRLILYVGGLIPRKGISTLLKAFGRLRCELPPESRICIVGEGPSRKSLEKEAERLGIAPQVIFTGHVNRNDVPLWMSAAEVLVLPSESEGRPNVVLEALATGIPVIATAVNGTLEIIRSGHNGLLFKPGDDATLAEQIATLFQQRDLAKALAAEGSATLKQHGLSWDSHGYHLDKIYKEMIL